MLFLSLTAAVEKYFEGEGRGEARGPKVLQKRRIDKIAIIVVVHEFHEFVTSIKVRRSRPSGFMVDDMHVDVGLRAVPTDWPR